MKKTIAWILAALLAVMLFPAAASAKQLTYKGFIYNTDFGTLAGYNDLLPNIVNIPKSIEHTDIVRIQGYAFSNAPMETVSVPDTIHQIGSFAFERCYNLKSFTSACKLERITEGLFQYCSSLKTVVLQDGPAIISQNAFRGCTSLEDITIPGSVQTVSNAAFGECTALKSIKMPENLKRICPCAFFRCTSLKEITLPEKTEKIEREAFGECRSLQKVTILCRYTNIEPSAFWDTKAVFYGLIGSEWQSTVENNGNTFRPLCKVTMYPSTDYTVTTAIYPEAGTAIAKPADPEKTGYTFGGWCTDYGCTQGNLWDFSTPVTEDMTLYSKWNLKSYRVNFEGSGQNGPANADYGTKLTKPRDPFRDGFVFAGWYKDSGFKHKWDFSKDTVKGDTTLYAKFTPFKSFKPALTAASADYQDIRLKWPAVQGAEGYEIWRSGSAKGKYKKVAAAADAAFTDSKLETGRAYYYKIRACRTDAGKTVYGAFSAPDRVMPAPAAAQGFTVKKLSGTSVKFKWEAVKGGTFYEVCRKAGKSGRYALIRKTDLTGFVNDRLIKGRTYTYRLRACCMRDGRQINGAYAYVSIKM